MQCSSRNEFVFYFPRRLSLFFQTPLKIKRHRLQFYFACYSLSLLRFM